MSKIFGVGIIGCGNISTAYFKLIPSYNNIKVVACTDINMDAARQRADEFGVVAQDMDALLANPEVDVVVNLTVPDAHFAVSKRALEAGKHVYSEKPFVLSLAEGEELKRIADAKGLKVGSAPDTFMGGTHQMARSLIEAGKIGTVTSGTAHVLSPGMEAWHPNPDFFFKPGGGPILDMGAYYVSNLLNLIGPVRRVVASANKGKEKRTIGSGPREGEDVPVIVPTNYHAILEFESGASVAFTASWDVWSHRHPNMELYGTDGAIFVPDPNFFGGELLVSGTERNNAAPVELWDHPMIEPNWETPHGMLSNYRGLGLADMMAAVAEGRDYRCSIERALHVMDVLLSILKSAEEGAFVEISTLCTQPALFGPEDARALLK